MRVGRSLVTVVAVSQQAEAQGGLRRDCELRVPVTADLASGGYRFFLKCRLRREDPASVDGASLRVLKSSPVHITGGKIASSPLPFRAYAPPSFGAAGFNGHELSGGEQRTAGRPQI